MTPDDDHQEFWREADYEPPRFSSLTELLIVGLIAVFLLGLLLLALKWAAENLV